MPATPAITLAGILLDVFGLPNAGFMTITLVGFGSAAPRVVGTAMLAPTAPVDVQADANGSYGFNLWANDQITPAGSYYTIKITDSDGNVVQLNAYQFAGVHNYDLSNVAPYIPVPVPPTPANAVLKNPPGGGSQTIAGSIVINGNLFVTGTFNFNFGMATVPINAGAPVFNGANGLGQYLVLTQAVGSATAVNFQQGIPITFVLKQDGTGGRPMAWPATFVNPPAVNPAPNGVTIQAFILAPDGNYYAIGGATWV